MRDLTLAPVRQRALLGQLTSLGGLTIAEAVALTKTSAATVRRDFDALARRGLAVRVHGGIVEPTLVLAARR
jgi:DeoR/GlpR family transcriptional regulator of sugar metabolism